MPDPLKKTVSASQAAALFNQSHYASRWMLWNQFTGALEDQRTEDTRMTWGKRLQPLLLQAAAEDLNLEVAAPDPTDYPPEDLFQGDPYIRNGPLGATLDGIVHDPSRGPGAVETKVVFDYSVWMQRWDGGKKPPLDYEIQVQAQMLVGDGRESYDWGVMAVLVCGQMEYFHREPVPAVWADLKDEARTFLDEVEKSNEPDPLGDPMELNSLNALVRTADSRGDLVMQDERGLELLETVKLFLWSKEQERQGKKGKEAFRAKILSIVRSPGKVLLPYDAVLEIKRSKSGAISFSLYEPNNTAAAPEPAALAFV